jgi:hypothetical protein
MPLVFLEELSQSAFSLQTSYPASHSLTGVVEDAGDDF